MIRDHSHQGFEEFLFLITERSRGVEKLCIEGKVRLEGSDQPGLVFKILLGVPIIITFPN